MKSGDRRIAVSDFRAKHKRNYFRVMAGSPLDIISANQKTVKFRAPDGTNLSLSRVEFDVVTK